MSSGTPSFRTYRPYDDQVDDPDAIWAGLPAGTDMRLFDAMPYQGTFSGMVSKTNMPAAGVHLTDNAVGGLIALWKAGGIRMDELKKRWPSTFMGETNIYKVRRPMGDPFLMLNNKGEVVYGLAFGHILLCGAGYKQDKWAEMAGRLKVDDYFWVLPQSTGKYLTPSNVLASPGWSTDDRGFLRQLSSAEASTLISDGRTIFPQNNSQSVAVKKAWNTPNQRRPFIKSAAIEWPKSASTRMEPGDVKADYPSGGRDEPFAYFPDDTPDPVLQAFGGTPSKSHAPVSQPGTPTPPKPKVKLERAQPTSLGRQQLSDSESSDQGVSVVVQQQPIANQVTRPESQSTDYTMESDEFQLISQCQMLEDSAMSIYANHVQQLNLEGNIDYSFYKAVKPIMDSLAKSADPGVAEQGADLKGALKRWYNVKNTYAADFDTAMDKALVPLDHMSAYSPLLTRTNTHKHRLIESAKDSYPAVPPDQACRRAIFKPTLPAYYAASPKLQASDLYGDHISAHLPGHKSKEVQDRRIDSNNPNALSSAECQVDNADLVAYLESCEPGHEKLPNPFHERASLAEQNGDVTTQTQAVSTTKQTKRKSAEGSGGGPTKKSSADNPLGRSSTISTRSAPKVFIPNSSGSGVSQNSGRANTAPRGRPRILGQSPATSRDSSVTRPASPRSQLESPGRPSNRGPPPPNSQPLSRDEVDWNDSKQRMAWVRQQAGRGGKTAPGGT